jgi:hypothetical protein
MNRRFRHGVAGLLRSWLVSLGGVALLLACPGCFNPELVNSTVGGLYPLAPGDTDMVAVTIINDTSAVLDLQILVDDGRLTPQSFFFNDLDPGTRTAGVLLPYPFLRVNIGNLENPFTPSIVATFPDTGLTIQVPSGLASLVAGKDFDSGDAIIYQIVNDARTTTGIRVDVGIVDGATQEGPFSRADTFEVVRLLLLQNGFNTIGLGTITTP